MIIQKLLGHAKFDTTSKYIHLDVQMLTQAVSDVTTPWAQPE